MRRSEINAAIAEAETAFAEAGWHLPPFATWSSWDPPQDQASISEMVGKDLGWDITDFGSGNYPEVGLCLFTLRNGSLDDLADGAGKVYAEKLMYVAVGQVTPLHLHRLKQEDIINRSGGRLEIQFRPSNDDESLGTRDVELVVDAGPRTIAPGGSILLGPGESVSIPPRVYHTFWAVDAPCVVGEVSSVNDDKTDNVFFEPVGRFPEIVEDEEPRYVIVGDYRSPGLT
ncbi:MAG: D-lyxose/D-mannose family sugar isomerase [Acidobacteria bacterium]|nr:D-lyxose/D-mannose family sugar isomerase [Acidobacteriota bacterium]